MSVLTQNGAPDERYPGFTCFKSFRPIRYSRRWYRLGLVKAALDPDIKRMGPSPVGADKLPIAAEFTFWAATRGGTRLIILTSSHIETRSISARMPVQIQYRSDLASGAAAAFSKAIWACKRRSASPAEQLVAADILRKNPAGVEIGSVMAEMAVLLGTPVKDTVEAIFSMVANGFLETDVSLGLSPHAVIRQGPMMAQAGLIPFGPQAAGAQMELFAAHLDPCTSLGF